MGDVGWGASYMGGLGCENFHCTYNLICHKLGVLSFLLKKKLLSTAFWIMWEKACLFW